MALTVVSTTPGHLSLAAITEKQLPISQAAVRDA